MNLLPSIGLDIVSKKSLRNIIKKLNRELNKTIILTSHDLDDIEKICKRVIIINNGEIVYDDSIKNLKRRYLNKKIFEMFLNNKIDKVLKINWVNILKKEDFGIKYEIDLKIIDTKTFLNELLAFYSNNEIVDINIMDRSIEEIIEEIYKTKI